MLAATRRLPAPVGDSPSTNLGDRIIDSISPSGPRIAVLVPCLDEAATIGDVVAGFQASLPGCVVHVYDNGSTDDTARLAVDAGAVVRTEPIPGKGRVVRRGRKVIFLEGELFDGENRLLARSTSTAIPTPRPTGEK